VVDPEVPEADALEQERDVDARDGEPEYDEPRPPQPQRDAIESRYEEAAAEDVAEQLQPVEMDEEDRR
jgi:hypothetical protein